ncbi:hypothetical protein LZ32DRAFT_297674 [Colletotrichum eremochloae]|nr:hypothetical protein LZ32DRAFT_297674 [Colletotrichum eremochloae]
MSWLASHQPCLIHFQTVALAGPRRNPASATTGPWCRKPGEKNALAMQGGARRSKDSTSDERNAARSRTETANQSSAHVTVDATAKPPAPMALSLRRGPPLESKSWSRVWGSEGSELEGLPFRRFSGASGPMASYTRCDSCASSPCRVRDPPKNVAE